MNTRSLGVALVFLAGFAVGGASARLLSRRQARNRLRRSPGGEYMCFSDTDIEGAAVKANAAGQQGWEMAGVLALGYNSGWCFKRPKM